MHAVQYVRVDVICRGQAADGNLPGHRLLWLWFVFAPSGNAKEKKATQIRTRSAVLMNIFQVSLKLIQLIQHLRFDVYMLFRTCSSLAH